MSEPIFSFVFSNIYDRHRVGFHHPESSERIYAALKGVEDVFGDDTAKLMLEPYSITESDLLMCHTERYINIVKSDVMGNRGVLSTGDTDISAESFKVALVAVGGVFRAIDTVMNSATKRVFCIVRPPGHHAESDRGMGFCIFNNVALGARYAQKKYGIKHVLIVDWDVHHGNGTQEIFYADPTVLYYSTHLWPSYPGTGRVNERGIGAGLGFTINRPLSYGAGGDEILKSMELELFPAVEKFKPDLIMISAGFDSRKEDPLGGLECTDEDFARFTKKLVAMSDRFANSRIISVLEGGYNLSGLRKAVRAHVMAMANLL